VFTLDIGVWSLDSGHGPAHLGLGALGLWPQASKTPHLSVADLCYN